MLTTLSEEACSIGEDDEKEEESQAVYSLVHEMNKARVASLVVCEVVPTIFWVIYRASSKSNYILMLIYKDGRQ